MQFQSSKRAGNTLEEVLNKEPDFAQWYTGQNPGTKPTAEFKRLVGVFDAKPFTEKCHGCGKQVNSLSCA